MFFLAISMIFLIVYLFSVFDFIHIFLPTDLYVCQKFLLVNARMCQGSHLLIL